MASFMSSFTSRDWSSTWLLSLLLRPQFLFQSSGACSGSAARNDFVEVPPSPLCGDSDDSRSDGGTAISQREIVGLGRIFDHFDKNKDGRISHDELRLSLHMFGIEIDNEELKAMIDLADSNSDGFLDFSEFAAFYYSLNEEMGQKMETSSSFNNERAQKNQQKDDRCCECDDTDLSDAFKLFDKNGDGYICPEELQSVLASIGLSQGKLLADCRNMIRSVDVDGDGQVSFAEFKQMMFAGFGQS